MRWDKLLKNRLINAKKEFLLLISLSVLLVIIQEAYFLQLFDWSNPLIFLYFTNFVNQTWDYCGFNILMMWVGALLVLISTNVHQKKDFWYIVLIPILLLSPFVLSMINLLVITPIFHLAAMGYSGIAAIFVGYGFGALTISAYNFLDVRSLKKSKIGLFYIMMGLFILVPFVNFVFHADPVEIPLLLQYGIIDGIYQTFVQTKINIFIHVVGYLFGLFIPLLLLVMIKFNLIEDQFSSSDLPK